MGKTKHRVKRTESPFVWDDADSPEDGSLPWWSAIKPDWWAGSTDFVLKRSLKLFVHGISTVAPTASAIVKDVEKLISAEDLLPSQIELLEADIAAGVQLGQLPDMALQLLYDSFTWGLPDWAMPESLSLGEFQENMKEHLKRDIMGETTE